MAKVIDIRTKLGRVAPKEEENGEEAFQIRFCGPDRHWVGLIGGILATALGEEGYHSAIEDVAMPPGSPPVLDLRACREPGPEPPGRVPGLVVAGVPLPPMALRGCDGTTLLLRPAGEEPGEVERGALPAVQVALPVAEAEPLATAVTGAAAAARLLGVVGWPVLERAVRWELTLSTAAAVDRHLATAAEAFEQLAPWAGVVLRRGFAVI